MTAGLQTSRSETVLVVDDERIVRAAVRNVLYRHGYTVLEASNGNDAVQMLQDQATPIDLLVTDVVMPGMTGVELMQQASAANPNLPVVYISGYMSDTRVQEVASGGRTWMLAKPFFPAMLMAAVQGALALNATNQSASLRSSGSETAG